MKKIRFEIKNQMGLARSGKFKLGKHSFRTPNLLIPVNESIINPIIFDTENKTAPQKKNQAMRLLNSQKLAGYRIEDHLNVFSTKINPKTDKKSNKKPLNISFFIESNNTMGIPKIIKKKISNKNENNNEIENENKKENKKENKNEIENNLAEIPILREVYPNSTHYRFTGYELEALKTRLKLYEELLFPKDVEQQYIIEFLFTKDNNRLNLIQDWIIRNIDHIIGIKILDLLKNLMSSKNILHWIFTLKSNLPSDLLWILGGEIFPQNYTMAFYLGFDLIDLRTVFHWGMKGLYISTNNRKWLSELRYPICSCDACNSLAHLLPGRGKENLMTKKLIISHNLTSAIGELCRSKQYIYDGTFRNYLESKIHADPMLASLLKNIDNKYGSEISSRYPLINSYPLQCIGTESYNRPEIKNYIERLKSEVTPARDYKIIIILPCSAKKPYSQSNSHKRFIKSINSAAHKQTKIIHEIIITSPVGVVPRELEAIFPAGHYDIPVTGSWDNEEIENTSDCLVHWLKKYKTFQNNGNKLDLYIITHLTGGYKKACQKAEDKLQKNYSYIKFNYTIPDSENISATSNDALEKLETEIRNKLELVKNFEVTNKVTNKITKTISEIESKDEERGKSPSILNELTRDEIKIRGVLDYQFGKGAGDLLANRGVIISKSRFPLYNEVFVYDGTGKIIVGRIMKNSGFIKLSTSGAELLIDHPNNKIKITEETMRGTTIFKPLLANLDPNSHPGDEMIALDKYGKFLGVGELAQPPKDIINASFGNVCSLRKKVKKSKAIKTDLDNLELFE